jgi:hypothetical protein
VRYPYRLQSFLLIIYNRFGTEVFRTDDIRKAWYGETKGSVSKQLETYFYYLKAEDACGVFEKKGDILVIP